LRAARVRAVGFPATCAIDGLSERVPISENEPQRPVNPYGESKLMVERMLRWYGEAHGITYASLRYFNAAGADPDGEIGEDHDPETHLIPPVLQAAPGRRPGVRAPRPHLPTPPRTPHPDPT